MQQHANRLCAQTGNAGKTSLQFKSPHWLRLHAKRECQCNRTYKAAVMRFWLPVLPARYSRHSKCRRLLSYVGAQKLRQKMISASWNLGFAGCISSRGMLFDRNADTTGLFHLRARHRCDLVFHFALDDELYFPALPAGRSGRFEGELHKTGSAFVLCGSAADQWSVGFGRSSDTIPLSNLRKQPRSWTCA